MRFVPSSVRARVTLVAAAAIVVVLAAVGWGLVLNHRRELTDSLDERMFEVLDRIAADVRESDPLDVDDLGEDDWVVQVVDSGGDVAAASSSIDDLAPLATGVVDQQTRTIDPLPGGDDDTMRLISRVVDTPGGAQVAHLAAPADDIADSVTTLQRALIVAIPLSAAALAMLTWVLVGRTLRPVERIRAEVAEIGGTDLHRRVPVPGAADEIGRLATTMNDMLARVEEAQVRQRRFVADASHELRGPLTRMRTELEVDVEHPATADPEATHRSVLEEVVGLQQLVDDLLLLARRDGGAGADASANVDLRDVVSRAVVRCRASQGVTVAVDAAIPATTLGRAGDLDRVVGNLLDNAIRHATAEVRLSVLRDGDTVSVVVEDDGMGVPIADQERIFERFARVDSARSADEGGTGLGLSIAREIVEGHNGTLVVDSSYDCGARFVVTLPSAG